MKSGPLKEKSLLFALRIVKLYKYLVLEQKEQVLSKQVLRSGTAIGALHRESECAESKSDFIHKLAIAQKECNETLYWFEILYKSDYLDPNGYNSLNQDANELYKLITSSIKTAKSSLKR